MSETATRKERLLQAVNLIANDLDQAHHIAQEFEGYALADTLHAIIHRREGDFSNSIYWWNRVGKKAPKELTSVYPDSDPVEFVAVSRSAGRADPIVSEVEAMELQALKIAITQAKS